MERNDLLLAVYDAEIIIQATAAEDAAGATWRCLRAFLRALPPETTAEEMLRGLEAMAGD